MNSRFSAAAGLAFCLVSGPALADLTPEQVWQSWSDYLEAVGYTVTAEERMSGSDLVVSGMTMTIPEAGGEVSIKLGDMTFADNGNGTVALVLPTSWPIMVHAAPKGEDETDATLTLTHEGFSMIASGTPEDLAYAYAAPSLEVALTRLEVAGQDATDTVHGFAAIKALGGSITWKTGETRKIKQVFNADAVSYAFSAASPDGSGSFSMSLQEVAGVGHMTLPLDARLDAEAFGAALTQGLALDAEYSFGAGKTEFAFAGNQSQGAGSSSSGGGTLSMRLDREALHYGASLREYRFALAASDVPVPINFELAEFEAGLGLPVAKSDTPQDAGFVLKLIGLAPDDMLWSMADPAGVFSHDPIDLVIDLGARMNWLFDIFDPAQADALAKSDMPLELHELDVRQLRLAAIGAMLEGVGHFTFDMSDLKTFDGLPAPDGKLDLRVVGANAVIDKLVQIGVLSENDAQGMRMMLALFGRPGEHEDEVLSTIEVKPDGQVLANGQRLQ